MDHEPVSTPLPLRALRTQVGGHYMIFEIDKEWVCKPMLAREMFFYQNLPSELKQFTPEYKGIVKVACTNSADGIHYTAHPIKSDDIERVSCIHSCTDDDDDGQPIPCSLKLFNTRGSKIAMSCDDCSDSNDDHHNPWIQFRMKQMSEILNDVNSSKKHRHIVLENLTGKLKRPCVIDLKLGTRTYSDIMSEEKKQSHSLKCAMSTSKSLGVRLGGMQLYCESDSKYYLLDKFYGHSLDEEGLYKILRDFLCNGNKVRTELIHVLVKKLKILQETVERMHSYRLYASSLLIIYDGVSTSSDAPAQSNTSIDVRMIDFGNATNEQYCNDPVKYTGPDKGYLKGLITLVEFYEGLLTKQPSSPI